MKRSFGVIWSHSEVIYVILSTIHISRDIWESSFTCICSSLSFHSTESSVTRTWEWTKFIGTGSVGIAWWVVTLVDISTGESITAESNVTFTAEIAVFVDAGGIIVTWTNLWVILCHKYTNMITFVTNEVWIFKNRPNLVAHSLTSVHMNPLPWYPELHAHVKEPSELEQAAFMSQGDDSHSLTSLQL